MSTPTSDPSPSSLSTQSPFFPPSIPIPPSAHRLIAEYSLLPPTSIPSHIQSIRSLAFTLYPYPCIGLGYFLHSPLHTHPLFKTRILPLLLSSPNITFLDAGCCVGQELRYLIHFDSVPGSQLYGFDLEPGFVDVGFELFCDREKLEAKMGRGDLMLNLGAEGNEELAKWEGGMDVVNASLLLHLWDWEGQVVAAKRLVSLARRKKGSVIVGIQLGSEKAGVYPKLAGKGMVWRHDEGSIRRFWGEVGRETGSEWGVECGWVDRELEREEKKEEEREREEQWVRNGQDSELIWFAATRL